MVQRILSGLGVPEITLIQRLRKRFLRSGSLLVMANMQKQPKKPCGSRENNPRYAAYSYLFLSTIFIFWMYFENHSFYKYVDFSFLAEKIFFGLL